VAAVTGIVTLVWVLQGHNDPVQPLTRTTVALAAGQQLDTTGRAAPLALSPDGLRLVYAAYSAGQVQLYVRSVDAFVATPLAGTEGAQYPFSRPTDTGSLSFHRGD
jgi:hypothetical protein